MSFRAFFSVDLEDKDSSREIAKIQRKIDVPDTKIKFVSPDILHLTLKFLGNIDEKILPDLEKDVNKIDFESFDIELKTIGCIPNKDYIKVIYVGITKGAEELKFIANELNKLTDKYNFKKERREFKAHLTIGRVKWIKNKELLIEKINEFEQKKIGIINVRSFKLKKSELTPQGPIYSTVFEKQAKS